MLRRPFLGKQMTTNPAKSTPLVLGPSSYCVILAQMTLYRKPVQTRAPALMGDDRAKPSTPQLLTHAIC